MSKVVQFAQDLSNSLAEGLRHAGTHTAQAAATANGISAAAQNAQGQFNQASANTANAIGDNRIAEQYGFNSAQAQIANDFTQNSWNQAAEWNEAMWEKTAAWNEMMWQKQADFNALEAQKNRDWQKKMASTSYQRAVEDMRAAGINPILASGGVGASAGGSGSAATVGGSSMNNPTMGAMSGQNATGGLMNGISASESSYTGQMEYMSGMLGLLSTAFGGLTTAMKVFENTQTGTMGENILKTILEYANPGKPLNNAINGLGKIEDWFSRQKNNHFKSNFK